MFGHGLRRPPDDTGPHKVHRRLRGRWMRHHNRPLRSGRRHHGRHGQDQGQRPEGRDLPEPRDPRREGGAVPGRRGPGPGHDRPSRFRRPVVHIGLRPEDIGDQEDRQVQRQEDRDLRGRRDQRRDRQDLRGSRSDRPGGWVLAVQAERHGAGDIQVEDVRPFPGTYPARRRRWE